MLHFVVLLGFVIVVLVIACWCCWLLCFVVVSCLTGWFWLLLVALIWFACLF